MFKEITHIREVFISLVLIFVLIVFTQTSKSFQPQRFDMAMIITLSVTVILYLALFWKEKALDERETVHKSIAGRVAYVVGVLVLSTGIIYQSLSHNVDPWLMYTLIGMVLGKVLGHAFLEIKN